MTSKNTTIQRRNMIRTLHSLLPVLRSKYGVRKMALFGSFASGRPSINSDVDLVVHLAKPIGFAFFEMKEFLEKKTGRRVDMLTKDGVNAIRSRTTVADIKKDLAYV